MGAIARAYELLILALAAISGVILTASFVDIVYDVVLRNLLISPPAFSVPSIEYGLLFITMFSAPWLVRTKGHVVVEVLRQALPPAAKRRLEKVVYVICVVICAVLTWKAIELWVDAWVSGDVDPRAVEIPHTIRYAPLVIGFALMTVEFGRYLFVEDSFYREKIEETEGV